MKNEPYLARLLFLLKNPTAEMATAGRTVIPECVEAAYIGTSAPADIFSAMVSVALKHLEA